MTCKDCNEEFTTDDASLCCDDQCLSCWEKECSETWHEQTSILYALQRINDQLAPILQAADKQKELALLESKNEESSEPRTKTRLPKNLIKHLSSATPDPEINTILQEHQWELYLEDTPPSSALEDTPKKNKLE